jgi:hypothetical protein
MTGRALAQIDGSWALQILSGEMSPLTALDRRLGRPGPRTVENIRAIVGGRSVRRIDARVERQGSPEGLRYRNVPCTTTPRAIPM